MAQQSHYDKIVTKLIKNEEFLIDENSGIIFGKRLNRSGNRIVVGYNYGKNNFCFSFVYGNRSHTYPVCRAVYLNKYKIIPKNFEVFNIDGNRQNNSIKNLEIRKAAKTVAEIKCWKEKEKKFLRKNYQKMSLSQLSIYIGRSEKSIRHAIKNYCLHPKKVNKRKWLEKDDELLFSLYGKKLDVNEIASRMNKSVSSIRLRANRFLGAFRAKHLKEKLSENNFYQAIKGANQRGSLWTKCCLCKYDKFIHFHHIDCNNKNHHISNMATLCPNHHMEITYGGKDWEGKLYAIWARKYSDGKLGKILNNKKYIKNKMEK